MDAAGVPTVTGPDGRLSGSRLGGRRAHRDVVSKQLKLDGDDVKSPVKINGERLAAGRRRAGA